MVLLFSGSLLCIIVMAVTTHLASPKIDPHPHRIRDRLIR